MPIWIYLLEKMIWFGFGAIGFAILFNVPQRTLVPIFLLAATGGITKIILQDQFDIGPVFSALGGATLIGVLSIQAAHLKHAPHIVFSIPSVIPMVPGVLTYQMMIGFVKLLNNKNNESDANLFNETLKNGLNVTFISIALVIGVSIPFLITRKNSVKFLKFKI